MGKMERGSAEQFLMEVSMVHLCVQRAHLNGLTVCVESASEMPVWAQPITPVIACDQQVGTKTALLYTCMHVTYYYIYSPGEVACSTLCSVPWPHTQRSGT